MIEELNETNFNNYIKTGLKVIMFYAEWCGYCKKQFSIFYEMENILIGIVDIDRNPNLALKYKITSFPTFVIFKNGEEISKFSGLHSKYDLMNKLIGKN